MLNVFRSENRKGYLLKCSHISGELVRECSLRDEYGKASEVDEKLPKIE